MNLVLTSMAVPHEADLHEEGRMVLTSMAVPEEGDLDDEGSTR